MKLYTPNYYKDFKCIAEKCKHNCCIGWEIDIDEDTFEYYQTIKGKFGKRLKKDITVTDECAYFSLDGKCRCAFLNKDNLCNIILNLGEDALCQVCSDHPRFRNFYDNGTEIGLGICCEEAGRLILEQKENFSLVVSGDEYEDEFIKYKNQIINNLQDHQKSLTDRVSNLLKGNSISLSDTDFNEWVDFYLSLERLDEKWTNLLKDLKSVNFEHVIFPESKEKYLEKLLLYFIYRHLDSMDTNKIKFSVLSVFFIAQTYRYHIAKYNSITVEDIIEYARLYSSEIEYSDENIEKIIEKLQKKALS